MHSIVQIALNDARARLKDKKLNLEVDGAAMDFLRRVGRSPEYGARPLLRVVQKEILGRVAAALLQQTVKEGDTVRVRRVIDDGFERLDIVPGL